jgi:hypothetical protein
MALLAGLYLVQPWPTLLAGLTPQQQVQAAVLADLWQLPAATEAAVGVLQQESDSNDRLSAVLDQLLSMPAVPDCLTPVFESSWQALLAKYQSLAAVPAAVLPVFEGVLLSKYGALEAVWASDAASLQASLLALPLYAMELLLASDKLKVCGAAQYLIRCMEPFGIRIMGKLCMSFASAVNAAGSPPDSQNIRVTDTV